MDSNGLGNAEGTAVSSAVGNSMGNAEGNAFGNAVRNTRGRVVKEQGNSLMLLHLLARLSSTENGIINRIIHRIKKI